MEITTDHPLSHLGFCLGQFTDEITEKYGSNAKIVELVSLFSLPWL